MEYFSKFLQQVEEEELLKEFQENFHIKYDENDPTGNLINKLKKNTMDSFLENLANNIDKETIVKQLISRINYINELIGIYEGNQYLNNFFNKNT